MKVLVEVPGKIEGLRQQRNVIADYLSWKENPAVFLTFEKHIFEDREKEIKLIKLSRGKKYYLLTGKKDVLECIIDGLNYKEVVVL